MALVQTAATHVHLMAPIAQMTLTAIKSAMASQSDLMGASATAAMKVAGTAGSGLWVGLKAAIHFMVEHSPTPGVDQFPGPRH